jgi:gamma-glutamyltranspeptidase
LPNVDLSPASRLRIETAEALVSRMHAPDWLETSRELLHKTVTTSHTAAVIAVDSRGNIAVVLHSCNCYGWGTAALFVDGVSIPEVAGATPAAQPIRRGARLPDFSAPILVLRQQRAALAAAATGSSLPELMLQNVVDILDWGMDPHEALQQPHYYGPSYEPDERRPGVLALDREVVHEGEFLPAILDGLSRRGQPLSVIPRVRSMATAGVWIGVRIDTSPRRLIGAVPAAFRAHLEGF